MPIKNSKHSLTELEEEKRKNPDETDEETQALIRKF
jgi:hypothetical protein